MTARQFVISKYPNAGLDFRLSSQVTNGGGYTYYNIRSEGGGLKGMILGRSTTALRAWKNAKKNIEENLFPIEQ